MQIVDLTDPQTKLTSLEKSFGAVYSDDPGHPPLPTRLMAGFAILKNTHDLSKEGLRDRWLENPNLQLYCGEEFFCLRLPFERSAMTRWRQRMGEKTLSALVQESAQSAAARRPVLAKIPVNSEKKW